MYLTVDLASKFSAAVLRDETGQVRWQGDSGNSSAFQWIDRLYSVIELAKPTHKVVEDVPYGISSQAMTKPVTRLQGALMYVFQNEEFYFLNPSTWQKEFPGVGRAPKGMSKTEGAKYKIDKAEEYCRELGYEAPDLVAKWQEENPDLKPLKKYTNPLEKQMTDYRDAFLMNIWLERHVDEYKTMTGVQPGFI